MVSTKNCERYVRSAVDLSIVSSDLYQCHVLFFYFVVLYNSQAFQQTQKQVVDSTFLFNFIFLLFYFTNKQTKQTKQTGPRPEGRYGHTGTLVNQTSLYIFGGRAQSNKHLRDVWCLDMSKDVFIWTKINRYVAVGFFFFLGGV